MVVIADMVVRFFHNRSGASGTPGRLGQLLVRSASLTPPCSEDANKATPPWRRLAADGKIAALVESMG